MGSPTSQGTILSFVQEHTFDVQSDLFAHTDIYGGLAELSDFSRSFTCTGIYTTWGQELLGVHAPQVLNPDWRSESVP